MHVKGHCSILRIPLYPDSTYIYSESPCSWHIPRSQVRLGIATSSLRVNIARLLKLESRLSWDLGWVVQLFISRYFCGYVVTASDLLLAHVVPPIQWRLTAKPKYYSVIFWGTDLCLDRCISCTMVSQTRRVLSTIINVRPNNLRTCCCAGLQINERCHLFFIFRLTHARLTLKPVINSSTSHFQIGGLGV